VSFSYWLCQYNRKAVSMSSFAAAAISKLDWSRQMKAHSMKVPWNMRCFLTHSLVCSRWRKKKMKSTFFELVIMSLYMFHVLLLSCFKSPAVRILEFVQFWQNPIPCCKEDRLNVSWANVGYNPSEKRVRNYRRRWKVHCRSLETDWPGIRSTVRSTSCDK